MEQGNTFVYVANSGSMDIMVMRFDVETGKLELVQQVSTTGSDARGPAVSLPLAVSPDRRFLYAAIRTEPYMVASFAIDGLSGKLTYLGNAPLPGSIAYLSTDRTGRFLLGASIPERKQKPRSSFICVSSIGPHGFCNNLLKSSVPSQKHMQSSRTRRRCTHHSGRPLPYASVRSSAQTLAIFSVDGMSGRLTHAGFMPTEKDPRSFAIDPCGRYLFVAGRGANNLTSFRIDQETGCLTNIAQYATGKKPDWVEVLRLP